MVRRLARKKSTLFWYDTEFIEDGVTIDLISIGVVDEEGNEFYAISSEFDESKASDWVQANVLVSLPSNVVLERSTKAEIRAGLLEFVGKRIPEWWAYFGAYDHVALSQLFGAMVDLPPQWPHYTRDIRQLADSMGAKRLPKQGKGTHDALMDARWGKRAYEYLIAQQKENLSPKG
jgi:hypothetical protein